MLANKILSDRQLLVVQVIISLVFCAIPLFITFPYKINLYLAWEGAYRISEGQVPFRDFGMPLGYGFWIIPAMFFKIFGPYMSSLIKAQVLINLISIVALNSTWRSLGTSQAIRTIGTAIFCFTYVFIHFWPWYNHTVYVFEWISIALVLGSFNASNTKKIIFAGFAGVFGFLSVFTKQDIGALGVFLTIALIIGDFYFRKDYKPGLVYLGSMILFGFLIIWPLTEYQFGYWYNYGQEPHSTRISPLDYLDELFSRRTLIYRLYFLAMLGSVIYLLRLNADKERSRKLVLLFLLTLGSLVQSILASVTSYVPLTSHFYFHAFFFVYMMDVLEINTIRFSKRWVLASVLVLIAFVWSQDPWKYSRRIINRVMPPAENQEKGVNRHTYIIKQDSANTDRSVWVRSSYRSLDNVLMPSETVEGFDWVVKRYKDRDGLKLLNMSELPQLYYEMDAKLEAAEDYPLWFHRNVSFFNREIGNFCNAIEEGKYDVVLFEDIPNLNGFYSPEVRECLELNYRLVKTFKAPRSPEISTIEVYER